MPEPATEHIGSQIWSHVRVAVADHIPFSCFNMREEAFSFNDRNQGL